MRMTIIIIAGIFMTVLSFSVSGQSKQEKAPIEYNNQMADITDSLYNLGQQWGTEFADIIKGDKDFSRLKPVRMNLSNFIRRTTEKIKREPVIGNGGEGLRAAVVGFLNYEQKMIENAFLPMEQLNSSSTQESIDAAINKLTSDASHETDMLNMVNAAQEAYGKQNGFTIEATAEE